ncbi:MAG: hypothetical protein WBB45_06970 [Cyclobacteriaceae bacterium]
MKTRKLKLDRLKVNSFMTGTNCIIGGRADAGAVAVGVAFDSPSQGAKVCTQDSC